MTRPIAALDADVLTPIIACDFLLTAADLGLYEPVVSTSVLDEVQRALIEDHPHLAVDAVRYRVAAMRDALEDQLVDAADVQVPDLINHKDHHVVGAALLGEATILTTNDHKLRAEVAASIPALNPLSLDEFGQYLAQEDSEGVSTVIDALVAKRHRPAISRQAMLASLRHAMPSAEWA